jgi:hypothetical protein
LTEVPSDFIVLDAAELEMLGGYGDPYIVDNSNLKSNTRLNPKTAKKLYEGDGLVFREEKVLDAKTNKVAPWGAVVCGTKDKDGWLKVGEYFLPLTMYSVPVMTPQAAKVYGLAVTLVGARGLRNADWAPVGFGKSDPYCSVQLQGKPSTKYTTRVVWNDLNPTWDEKTEIKEYCQGEALEFSIYDRDPGKKDDFLGHARLESKVFHADGFSGELELHETGLAKGAKAFLKVKVMPLRKSQEEVGTPKRRMSTSFVGEALKDVADEERMSGLRSTNSRHSLTM